MPALKQRLADYIFDLRTRSEWFDDLLDLLWYGRAYHVDVLCPPDEQSDCLPYANWLRQQGSWTLRLVPEPAIEPMDLVLLSHRGPALFRWGKRVEYLVMERSGAPFDPDLTVEA